MKTKTAYCVMLLLPLIMVLSFQNCAKKSDGPGSKGDVIPVSSSQAKTWIMGTFKQNKEYPVEYFDFYEDGRLRYRGTANNQICHDSKCLSFHYVPCDFSGDRFEIERTDNGFLLTFTVTTNSGQGAKNCLRANSGIARISISVVDPGCFTMSLGYEPLRTLCRHP